MKRLLAILLALAPVCASMAQVPPSVVPVPAVPAVPGDTAPEPPEKIIARFFSYLQRKEVEQAYDQLTRGTKIAERAEDVKTLKAKTKDAIEIFGPILGYETVGEKHVGTRLVMYTAMSLGKEFPLRWRFYFYKPVDVWKLIDLRVDDRLAMMFDEPDEGRSREERP